MPFDRLRLSNAKARWWRWWIEEVIHAPLEPILHPSRLRLVWIGAFSFAGHLLFYWIWAHAVPQPYENLWARVFMAFMSLIYLMPSLANDAPSAHSGRLFALAVEGLV